MDKKTAKNSESVDFSTELSTFLCKPEYPETALSTILSRKQSEGLLMVKGVNKTIIEVNNTGSKMFEKIVFYVTPQYGNADSKKLQKAAAEFSFQFSEHGSYVPLRHRHKKRKRKLIIAGLIASLSLLTVMLILFL